MASRKSMSKRKYPAVTTKEGKWYTGYEGEYATQEYLDKGGRTYYRTNLCTESDIHETKILKLQPSHTSRGRSAANIVCKDEQGFEYLMSMKSIDNFLHALVGGCIIIQNGYFEAEWCQVKQGQNYFIDLVED